MSPKHPVITVTVRALMARVNRKLAHDGQILKVSRSAAEKQSFGYYYTADISVGAVKAWNINDLEKWVRTEFDGLLKPFEKVEV